MKTRLEGGSGPLNGLFVVEIAGIGPGPFAAMCLADLGATVVRVDRAESVQSDAKLGAKGFQASDLMNRNRYSIGVNLKSESGRSVVLDLVKKSDALIEGFRPGVAERLGIGPGDCFKVNKKLIYGRMTGFGQDGPLKDRAGHDINYISISGALSMIGREGEKPIPPLNLVGDFGGGGLILAFGIMCGIFEAARSGEGQVVDAAMVDGSALLSTFIYGLKNAGFWNDTRGVNLLDSGAHFYEVYETKDGKYMSVGAIEPQFYKEFLELSGLGEDLDFLNQMNRSMWPTLKEKTAVRFLEKSRDEWNEIFEGSDACVFPVIEANEVMENDHLSHRRSFEVFSGIVQPNPAPRFSKTPGELRLPPPASGEHSDEVLRFLGYNDDTISELKKSGSVA